MYGHAMSAKYFQHDSPMARRFVNWFKRPQDIDGRPSSA